MRGKISFLLLVAVILTVAIVLSSCGEAPTPPQENQPADGGSSSEEQPTEEVSLTISLVKALSTDSQAEDVAVEENTAAVADGEHGISFVDVSDPENPRVVGRFTKSDANVRAVAVKGSYTYATLKGYFTVIDINDPSNPEEKGSVYVGVCADDIFLDGDRAYVAASGDDESLQVVDVSDPENPTVVTSLSGYGIKDVVVSSGYAYAVDANGNYLRVFDVSDLPNITEIGSLEINYDLYSIALYGNYAIVGHMGGITVVDVSDPSNPVVVKDVVETEGAKDLFASGSKLYVADGEGGLRIFNLSNPSNPEEILHLQLNGQAEGVFYKDGYVYLADYNGGLVIIDEDSGKPAARVFTFTGNAKDVFVKGGYAYVADYDNGLIIYDVSDPENAFAVGRVDIDRPLGVFVDGDYAYVATDWNGLFIVNVEDPSSPVVKAKYMEYGGYVKDVFVQENRAYYISGMIDFVVLDVSDPSNPDYLGSYSAPSGDMKSVVVSDGKAFIADADRGLVILDVSNPQSIREISAYEYKSNIVAQDIALDKDVAYIADYELYVIDVSDTSNPELLSNWNPLSGVPVGVFVEGNIAYVSAYNFGVYALDVSDPSSPTLVAEYKLNGGDGRGKLFVKNDYIYYAAGSGGFLILKASKE